MKYQKKPVTVEAWILKSDYHVAEIDEWVQQALIEGKISFDYQQKVWEIKTYNVTYFADDGFYLVKEDGEINSYRPDIFEEMYVKVNDTNRISPDDIGNDIHEFLHGGDK